MDINILYNVPHYMPLGELIAIYFYFTGLSAGSFVISVVSVLAGRTEYKPIAKIGAVMAPILLIAAPIFLLVDLERPLRAWHLFFYFNWTSPITYGTFLLTLYPINGIIYGYFTFKGPERWAKILGTVGIPLAIATHGYTGFILALGKGRALWSTALMPTLFIVSAMVSGIALVIVVAFVRNYFFQPGRAPEQRENDKQLLLKLGKFMGLMILVDLFMVMNAILVLLTSTREALEVVRIMLFGSFAWEFLGVEIFLGGLVPAALIFIPRTGKTLPGVVVASVLTLIGVYSMRVVVVIAGQSLPLH